MLLEVLSTNSNATTQIIAGLKRRTNNLNEILYPAAIQYCNEIAQELNLVFELNENNNLTFKDKQ